MAVQIKFCGLTRLEDVAAAEQLGGAYTGVIFAGGPRNRTVEQAAALFRHPSAARRVGVFGECDSTMLESAVRDVPLDVVQLHADPDGAAVTRARAAGAAEVWGVVRVDGAGVPASATMLFLTADAVVLDTKIATRLGGSGRTFDWDAVAAQLESFERRSRLVVAGGLTAENVASAIQRLRPDVVDVSSGVESAPGVKDHLLMRRFVEAVRSA